MNRHGSCEACGAHAPVIDAVYHQNTGMLVVRETKTVRGAFCKSCSLDIFWRMTLHNLVFGWWGFISFFVTPLFMVNNLYQAARTMFLPDARAAARSSLEDQREYAIALLKTKDNQTVVEVLASATHLPEEEVAAFVAELRRELWSPASHG